MIGHQNNPWNADKTFSTAELWPGCGPIIRSMWRRLSGIDSLGCLQYMAERYMQPVLTNWDRYTPAERQNQAYRHVFLKKPEDYRCLILGSNEGRVERLLCSWGFVGEIVATDIAENALARAKAEAQRLGYTNIQHIQADLNVDCGYRKFKISRNGSRRLS